MRRRYPPLTPPRRGISPSGRFLFPSWEGLGVGKKSVSIRVYEEKKLLCQAPKPWLYLYFAHPDIFFHFFNPTDDQCLLLISL